VRLLLDSNALAWWFSSNSRMSVIAARAIRNPANEIVVSVASVWELAIKDKLGKLRLGNLLEQLPGDLEGSGFSVLPILLDHGIRAGSLPAHHKDPFDRMLVAQAHAESLVIVSSDPVFDHYGVRRLW
jgi:PIN domain nuclease of toxin-antitoxin system